MHFSTLIQNIYRTRAKSAGALQQRTPYGFAKLCCLLLLILVCGGMLVTPVWAASGGRGTIQKNNVTALDAAIYLTGTTLQPLFQERLNQQIPGLVDGAITNIVNKLPATNRGWAQQMATTLIQPEAALTSLTPQQGGLATSLHLSLYPGDPQPIDSKMLVTFSVLNPTTIQVSAQPTAGSPALVNGPLTTFQVPIGQLNSIVATPACGDAALAVKLQVPVSLSQGTAHTASTTVMKVQQKQSIQKTQTAQSTVNAYVEIPSTALSSLGGSIGTLPIDQTLTASNIRLGVQGGNLVVTSDIMLGSSTIRLATASSYMQPQATNGNLAVQVVKTNVSLFSLITFKDDAYNKQIEQTLNTKLNGLLAGKFTVTNAAIGSNTHLPCVTSDSLLLTGTTNLG